MSGPVMDDSKREEAKARLRDVWSALGCAPNPDDFKPSVQEAMWEQALGMIRDAVSQQSSVYRENQKLRAALTPPADPTDDDWLDELADGLEAGAGDCGVHGGNMLLAAKVLRRRPTPATREEIARALDETDPEGGASDDSGGWEWWIEQADALLSRFTVTKKH